MILIKKLLAFYKRNLQLFLLLGGAINLSANHAFAQSITFDGTLGATKTLTSPNYSIRQEDGKTVNGNLFHSFERFNLKTNETAVFESDSTINNIFSRVTGGSPSIIDGLIRAKSDAVNLFFINPSGIIFGKNARLDVGGSNKGSFVATTLDTVIWSDGSKFSAINPGNANSLLTIVGDPSGFLSSLKQPAAIEVTGAKLTNGSYSLNSSTFPDRLYEGQSLLLIGGDVKVDGASLKSPDGRVELGGISAPGVVGLNVDGNIFSLNFSEDVSRASVFVTNASEVDVRNIGGGSIAINAQNLYILGGSSLRAGISENRGSANARAGDIKINAVGDVRFDGEQPVTNLSGGVFNRIERGATGSSGNINIAARSLKLTNGALVTASNWGNGNAGNINIDVREQVSLDGEGLDTFPSGVYSQVVRDAEGRGGNINISAGSLSASEGAVITTGILSSKADSINISGNININVREVASVTGERNINGRNRFSGENPNSFASGVYSQVEEGGKGQAGSINFTAGSLLLNDGAYFSAGTFGTGNAGNVNVNVGGEVNIQGVRTKNGNLTFSGLYSQVGGGSVGNAGNINLTAGSLLVNNGAYISASSLGKGNAGDININVGGKVDIQGVGTANNNFIASGVYSQVSPTGVGNAGDVKLTGGSLLLGNGGSFSTSTLGTGNAGDVNINVTGEVSIQGVGISDNNLNFSSIYSRVGDKGIGNAGNVNLKAGSLSINDGAYLSASTLGKGDAGNVNINVAGEVDIQGIGTVNNNFNPSSMYSIVGTNGVGSAGNINLRANSLKVRNGGVLSSSTYGTGNGGVVNVNVNEKALFTGEVPNFDDVPDSIFRFGSGIYNRVEAGATGNGGKINVTVGSLEISKGAVFTTSTDGKGINGLGTSAGDITVNVTYDALLDGFGRFNPKLKDSGSSSPGTRQPSGIFSTLKAGARGSSGNISLTAGNLTVSNGATLYTSTRGIGNAGKIVIDVRGRALFSGEQEFAVERLNNKYPNSNAYSEVERDENENTIARGNGGDILIKARLLDIEGGATISTSALGIGNAGKIAVDAKEINISGVGEDGAPSGIFSSVESLANGNGRAIEVKNVNQLQLLDGGVISTSTEGKGNAGTVTIGSREIPVSSFVLSGVGTNKVSSGVFSMTEPSANGVGGNISVNALSVQLRNAAVFSAQTQNSGSGGSVDINTNFFLAENGGQVITSTSGKGKAGNIILNASNINVFGGNVDSASGLFANTEKNSSGNGGSIAVNRDVRLGRIRLADGGKVSVDSRGLGTGGDIELFASRIDLNNFGAVTSETQSTDGGNITLNLQDLLLMRYQSRISTNAGTAQAGGNGGIITINANDGFLIAYPTENSDITANAYNGKGGNVTVNANAILGFVPRSRSELQKLLGTTDPEKLNPSLLPSSDITAISQANSSLDGVVNINALISDPTRGTNALPSEPGRPTISQTCQGSSNDSAYKFIITGRGGRAPSPAEALSNNSGWRNILNRNVSLNQNNSAEYKVIEAQGIYIDTFGDEYLLEDVNRVTPYSPWEVPASCVENIQKANNE